MPEILIAHPPLDFPKDGFQLWHLGIPSGDGSIAPSRRPRVNRGSTGSTGTVPLPALVPRLHMQSQRGRMGSGSKPAP